MPDSNTSVMFMPDDAPAPAAPKTYSRQALVEKGMSKGWDRARAEAAADVKLARETGKVWESAAPGEDFSAVAKRAGELVPEVYTAPEEVSSMPVPPRQKIDLAAAQKPRGLMTEGNIDLHKRPVVKNPDGTYSTVYSYTVGMDEGTPDASWFLIPGVARDGSRRLTGDEAFQQFRATNEHLGRFDSPSSAEEYANRLHEDQANEYESRAASPTRMRSREELTPGEIRAVDVAERAREDAAAAEASRKAQEIAHYATLVTDPLNLASKGMERTVGRAAAGVSRLLGKVGPEAPPTDVELALRMGPPSEDKDLAYAVPSTNLPSEAYDFAAERVKEWWQDSPAYRLSAFLTEDVPKVASAAATGLEDYSEFAAKTNERNALKPLGKEPTLEQFAKNARSWDIVPTQSVRERATNARMFQQAPEKLVPLGNYNLDQSLFDVIDTPEGAVEKGLEASPGFLMWEKEHPVRAQKARETVAAQRAERAPAERAAQRQEVRQRTVEDYLSANILPAIEKMKDYNLTPDEYRALQVAGALTGRQTEEGDIELAGGDDGERVREMLKLKKEDPDTFAALVAALPKGP